MSGDHPLTRRPDYHIFQEGWSLWCWLMFAELANHGYQIHLCGFLCLCICFCFCQDSLIAIQNIVVLFKTSSEIPPSAFPSEGWERGWKFGSNQSWSIWNPQHLIWKFSNLLSKDIKSNTEISHSYAHLPFETNQPTKLWNTIYNSTVWQQECCKAMERK